MEIIIFKIVHILLTTIFTLIVVKEGFKKLETEKVMAQNYRNAGNTDYHSYPNIIDFSLNKEVLDWKQDFDNHVTNPKTFN